MKKFIFSFILISLFIVGCDPINDAGDKASLLPIAVDSKNCPVCPVCPDPTVCPVYETKIYWKKIVCAESLENSTITIFKVVSLKDSSIESIKYIGILNHDKDDIKGMEPFIITTERSYKFCYCYVKLVGNQIQYDRYDGEGENPILDSEWFQL